jgi:hypothetical protein
MLIAARSSQDFACCARANRERTLQMSFRFRRIRLGKLERDFPSCAIDLGLAPPSFGRLQRCDSFANAAPSLIDAAKDDNDDGG